MVGGGSRGLGYACARALAAEGARVSLCARHAAEAEQAAARIAQETGARVLGLPADLAAAGEPERWVERTREGLGPVDILVHNTGGPRPGAFEDLSDADWEEAFRLLVLSAVRLYRAVLPDMVARGWGRIVAIESMSVKEPIDGLVLSNALRPAVVAISKSLSRTRAAEGIRFNVVAPGSYDTDRIRELYAARARAAGVDPEKLLEDAVRGFPLRRLGAPDELASVVTFLCSNQASNVNGVTLPVDGGAIRSLT